MTLALAAGPTTYATMSAEDALQLKTGDWVDHRCDSGRFYVAQILRRNGSKLYLRYQGCESDSCENDCVCSDIDTELWRFAKVHSITQRPSHRMCGVEIDEFIRVRALRHPWFIPRDQWVLAKVKSKSNGQIESVLKAEKPAHSLVSDATAYWTHTDNAAEIDSLRQDLTHRFQYEHQPTQVFVVDNQMNGIDVIDLAADDDDDDEDEDVNVNLNDSANVVQQESVSEIESDPSLSSNEGSDDDNYADNAGDAPRQNDAAIQNDHDSTEPMQLQFQQSTTTTATTFVLSDLQGRLDQQSPAEPTGDTRTTTVNQDNNMHHAVESTIIAEHEHQHENGNDMNADMTHEANDANLDSVIESDPSLSSDEEDYDVSTTLSKNMNQNKTTNAAETAAAKVAPQRMIIKQEDQDHDNGDATVHVISGVPSNGYASQTKRKKASFQNKTLVGSHEADSEATISQSESEAETSRDDDTRDMGMPRIRGLTSSEEEEEEKAKDMATKPPQPPLQHKLTMSTTASVFPRRLSQGTRHGHVSDDSDRLRVGDHVDGDVDVDTTGAAVEQPSVCRTRDKDSDCSKDSCDQQPPAKKQRKMKIKKSKLKECKNGQ